MKQECVLSTKMLMDKDISDLSNPAFRLFVNCILKATKDNTDGVVSFAMLPSVAGWSGLTREEVPPAALELEEKGFLVPLDVRSSSGVAKSYTLRSFMRYQDGLETTSGPISVADVRTGQDLERYMMAALSKFHQARPDAADLRTVYRSFIAQVPKSVRNNFTQHAENCACPTGDAPGGAADTCVISSIHYKRSAASVATAEQLEYRSVVVFVMSKYLNDSSIHALRQSVDSQFASSQNYAQTSLALIDAVFKASAVGKASLAYVNGILNNQRKQR